MPDQGLHEHAVQAESHLEQLATGLAQAGASPETIKAVSQMAEVTRKIVVALGKGQEQAGDAGPSAGEQPQGQGPAPEQAGPTMQQPQTIDSATQHLHHAMQQSARGGY